MTTTINLNSAAGAGRYPLGITVYYRQNWADDWTVAAGIGVDRVIWAAAPRISTAQLYWRYGFGKLAGAATFQQLTRKDWSRFYIKIGIRSPSLLEAGNYVTTNWYGIVDLTRDIIEGPDLPYPQAGQQALIAYGLEAELYRCVIRDIQFVQKGTGTVLRYMAGLECNADGKANRTPSKTADGYYVFAEDLSTAQFWSTRDIVEYVIGDHGLHDSSTPDGGERQDGVSIPMTIDAGALANLPNWDAPEVTLHGKSPGQVLNQVIARQRLLGWYAAVDELTTPDTLKIVPFTFTGTPITITAGKTIAANSNTKHVEVYGSSESDVAVQWDSSGQFDQVIVEGCKRRSVFTIGQPAGWGYTLQAGWTTALETLYEQAGSTDPAYPTDIDDRRRRNALVRGSDKLATVFSRFEIPDTWNFTCGDGGGVNWYPVFLPDVVYGQADEFDLATIMYRPHLDLLPTLPLLADVDYSGGITGGTWLGKGDRHEEMAPIVLIETPEQAGKFVVIETAGIRSDLPRTHEDGNDRWSASVRVNSSKKRDPAIYVNVSGQAQHVIAGADFSPLAEDKACGAYDWRTMVATVAVEEDRRCYGAYPEAGDLPSREILRVLRIQADDSDSKEFRQDFMPEGTVLGINQAGELVKSPQPQWINDARTKLYELAKFAFQWYGIERCSLELSTKKVNGHLSIGDLIVSLSRSATADIDIGTCITQIMLDNPLSSAAAPPVARMTIITAYAELDPLKV